MTSFRRLTDLSKPWMHLCDWANGNGAIGFCSYQYRCAALLSHQHFRSYTANEQAIIRPRERIKWLRVEHLLMGFVLTEQWKSNLSALTVLWGIHFAVEWRESLSYILIIYLIHNICYASKIVSVCVCVRVEWVRDRNKQSSLSLRSNRNILACSCPVDQFAKWTPLKLLNPHTNKLSVSDKKPTNVRMEMWGFALLRPQCFMWMLWQTVQ